MKFIGAGILTDNTEDYTVDLVQSKVTYDNTVYNSDPVTVNLENLGLLDLKVSVEYDRSVKSVKIGITGFCAGSTEYTAGNLETVHFELHQWLHLSNDSAFDSTALVINEETGFRNFWNCTVSKVVLTVETDAEGHVSDLSENTYTLTELKSLGLNVSVHTGPGSHNDLYVVQSDIVISGRSACSSTEFVDAEQSRTYSEYDYAYYTASATDLGSVAPKNAIKWSEEYNE